MAGLTHFSELFAKRGEDFIQKLLTYDVTVSEKLDGSSFNVKKLKNGFEFYKRDGKTPITSIDRTLSVYHELPIRHFESLSQDIVSAIPTGTYFSFEYFATLQPVSIIYDTMPKNGLVLSSIKESNGTFVYDRYLLDMWADTLNVERAPILFQGFLSDEQKQSIIEFISTPFENLIEKYKSRSFSKFIVPLINPELSASFFKKDLDSVIEGIVFNFKGDDETVLAKLVDPAFTAMAKAKAATRIETPSDIYGLVVSDITDFINSLTLKDFNVKGTDFSSIYIDLMSQIFLEYYEFKGDEFKDVNFNTPEFLNKPEHTVNISRILYPAIVKLIKSNKNNEELYKIFVATFRKRKTKAYGYFTREFIHNVFNKTIDNLHTYINSKLPEITADDVSEFLVYNESDELLTQYEIPIDLDLNELPDETFKPNNLITDPAQTPVNIVVGRFQPIHKGHISISKFLKDANGYDTVYVAIRGSKPSIKSPISVELQDDIFSEVKANEPHIVDFLYSNRVIFNELFTQLRSLGYEPMSLGTGDDREETYKEQLDFMLNKRNNMMNVHKDFEIINIPRNIIKSSGTLIRECIINDDKETFDKFMPSYLLGHYYKIQNEILRTIKTDEFDISTMKLTKEEKSSLYSTDINENVMTIKCHPLLEDKIRKWINSFNIKEYFE